MIYSNSFCMKFAFPVALYIHCLTNPTILQISDDGDYDDDDDDDDDDDVVFAVWLTMKCV